MQRNLTLQISEIKQSSQEISVASGPSEFGFRFGFRVSLTRHFGSRFGVRIDTKNAGLHFGSFRFADPFTPTESTEY
jgi:hypothetical protein